jgi:hypothetical protein
VTADPEQFFDERGIPEHIWRARPYGFWTTDDITPATEPFADQGPAQRAWAAKIANQSDGILIMRAPPPMATPLAPIPLEFRPDNPVVIETIWHWHGNEPPPPDLPPWKRLPGARCNWQAHIDRDKGPDDHRGHNTELVHSHRQFAKYVFPIPPTVEQYYEHDHEHSWQRKCAADRPAYHRSHVNKHHGGVDVVGLHEHTRRVKDRTTPIARRIDAHPLAVGLLRCAAEVVYLVIEGCIKADAVLADGGAVLSVPSVSLWDCTELGEVALEYLVGRTVVVVPDADWHHNDAVINQARLCQAALFHLGVSVVYVAAPPPTFHGTPTKGVDDFIGAGGHLEELLVIDAEPSPYLDEFAWARCHRRRLDQAQRNHIVLRALAAYTGTAGVLRAPLETVARVIGVTRGRLSRAVHDLADMGAVDIEGDLATRRNWFSRRDEFVDPPAIILAPDLRSTEREAQRLADVVPQQLYDPKRRPT